MNLIALSLGAALVLAAPSAATASPAPQVNATRGVSDDILKDRILYRIDTDTTLRKYDIRVAVQSGIATLTGDVATEAQKKAASRVASIDGVSRVKNDLRVAADTDRTLTDRAKQGLSKAGDTITDAWITAKVRWFFVGEEALKGSDINVDTTAHVVTLKGTVKSAAGRTRAVALAKNTEGVTRVVDQLIVSSTE
jgi:hyperosmotically inducible periplasmic protein